VVDDVKTFADVVARKPEPLTPEENDVYTAAGATNARMAVSTLPNSVNALVLTVQVPPGNASTAVGKLTQLQMKYGLQTYTGTAPAGVKVTQIAKTTSGRALVRGHYMHNGTVVRVHVEGNDLAEVSRVFDEILAAQLDALPVTG
jgi:hypothetical protein